MGHGWGSEDPHPPIPVGRWVAGFLRKLADWIDPPDKFIEDMKADLRKLQPPVIGPGYQAFLINRYGTEADWEKWLKDNGGNDEKYTPPF